MPELKVFHNEVEWVIAESADEARQIVMDLTGYSAEDAGEYHETAMGDWLRVHYDLEKKEAGEGELPAIEKTMAEWIEIHGKGWLCTSEW